MESELTEMREKAVSSTGALVSPYLFHKGEPSIGNSAFGVVNTRVKRRPSIKANQFLWMVPDPKNESGTFLDLLYITIKRG